MIRLMCHWSSFYILRALRNINGVLREAFLYEFYKVKSGKQEKV